MVVRASNVLYGQDACAYISAKVKSGYVLDLEGDLTSSNGADRTNAFDACMSVNYPSVKIEGPDRLDSGHCRHRCRKCHQCVRKGPEGDLRAMGQPGLRDHRVPGFKGVRPRWRLC